MDEPQIIRTEAGEELVVVPRRVWDDLVGRAGRRRGAPSEAEEDAGTERIVARSEAARAAGREVALPSDVATAIARGENPVRAVRAWRGLTQNQLADAAGIDQGYVSAIESGKRTGTAPKLRRLADALGVPLDLLVD